MPELRKDPITERWVIIATERARRPMDLGPDPEVTLDGLCPFCPGHEGLTPPEIVAFRNGSPPNGPGWELRVIPNKFPALRVEGPMSSEGVGLYDKMTGIGAHEVIIETPQHGRRLADYTEHEIQLLLRAYRERMRDLKRDARLKYTLVFKNEGSAAGATQPHSHSQLIALPIVPKRVMEELRGSSVYFGYKHRCVYCDIVRQEIKDGERLVVENPDYLAIAPFASRHPFELWILPRAHEACFEDTRDDQFVFLAKIISQSIRRLVKALDRTSYNLTLHTTPFGEGPLPHYHWHMEITTRLTKIAGFERGSGFYINPTPPEEAAAYLRSIKL